MGDAVMERVAPVPELPELETSWVRSDSLGNSRRQSQLGGPVGRSAREAIEDANHGAAAGLLPVFLPGRGMSVVVDELRGRIWVEKTDTADLGLYVPGVGPGADAAEVVADALSGGRAGLGYSESTSIAIGLPISRARGLTGDAATSMRADEVAALLGLDYRSWVAARAVAGGDLARASDLPGGAIVRSAHSVGARAGADADLSPVSVPGAAKFELGGGRATETTVHRVGNFWIADVSRGKHLAVATGVGLALGLPGADVGRSGGLGLDRSQRVTLQAADDDTDALATLSEVLRFASGSTADPIAAVPGADALQVDRWTSRGFSASTRLGAFINSFTLDDDWESNETEHDAKRGGSVAGDSRIANTASFGFDNALTRTLSRGGIGPSGGTQGEVAYTAVGEEVSVLIGGGSTGTLWDVEGRNTQVRLTPYDADVIMRAARSEQVWKQLYADLGSQSAWLSLRTELLQAQPDPNRHGRDPDFAVRVARLKLIASFVATDTDAVEPLLNLLGRGKLARVGKASGVLECWPEGFDAVRARYDYLGAWMELVPQDAWGEHDPFALLLQLGQCADQLYGQIESFTRVSERARLEMLGQVLAWQDTIDDTWCRIGVPGGACGDVASHRPSSLLRLENLAGECRSEASPHLFVLEPLLCRSSEVSAEQAASFDALAGILSYWKLVAADLRRACADAGLAESSWLVRPDMSEPERDLDPPLQTWGALRRETITTRPKLEVESTYALL